MSLSKSKKKKDGEASDKKPLMIELERWNKPGAERGGGRGGEFGTETDDVRDRKDGLTKKLASEAKNDLRGR